MKKATLTKNVRSLIYAYLSIDDLSSLIFELSKSERLLISENALLDQNLPFKLTLSTTIMNDSKYISIIRPKMMFLIKVCNHIDINIGAIELSEIHKCKQLLSHLESSE